MMLGGCERTPGRTIDTKIIKKDDLEILVIRRNVRWYDEFVVKYWCRSPATMTSERSEDQDHLEPDTNFGQGWRYFSGYGTNTKYLLTDDPISKIAIYDSKTAYVDNSLTMTFDGCRTRVYFNWHDGSKFEATMTGKGIRYPQYQFNVGTPFLQNMKVHEGGGCFEINPEYVEERKQYFYCSSDVGKTWTLETERKQTLPIAPPPVVQPVAPPAASKNRSPSPK